jgi:PAS domain S-box-containing protein
MTLKRYLTGLIWLCVAPLLALAALLAVDHVRDVNDHSREHAQGLAQAAAASIDDALRDRISALLLLASSPLADDAARQKDFYAEAQNYLRHFGHHLIQLEPDGRTLRFTTRAPLGSPLPLAAVPRGRVAVDAAAISRQPEVSDVFIGSISKQPLISAVVPAIRGDRLRFYLLSAIETRWLEQRLSSLAPPAGWTMMLRDSQGEPLARQGPALSDADAETALHFVAPLAQAPWRIELAVPRGIYTAPAISAGASVSAGLAMLTLAGVLGGSIAARRLARAMEQLAHGGSPGDAAAPQATIREIADVQALIANAARRRDELEAERREDERRFRESIEAASLQLQLSEARLRSIVDGASEGIITADMQQHILLANRAAARIYGYEPQALIGQPLDLLIPERFRARHRLDVQAFGEAESPARPMGTRPPVLGLRANGEEFPIEAAISYVHVDGQRLFTVIVRDITERLRAEEQIRAARAELEASHAELRRLVAARDGVQEQERKRIARELHDDLQQTLAAIKMDTLAIEQQLQRDPARVPPMLAKIDELATGAIASTRRIVNDLRPKLLEELGLRPALEALASDFAQRTGIDCSVDAAADGEHDAALAAPVANCLYRVTQEALNNVIKHAGARHVRLTLAHAPGGRVRLRIHDDGRGLTPQQARKPHSFGLVGMDERVRAIGGRLTVTGQPGAGTVVEVEVDGPGDLAAPAR